MAPTRCQPCLLERVWNRRDGGERLAVYFRRGSGGLPASSCNPAFLTELEFVGPNSPNTSKTAIPADWDNIGPAVGFAYQIPWFENNPDDCSGWLFPDLRGLRPEQFQHQRWHAADPGIGSRSDQPLTTAAQLSAQFPGEVLKLSDLPRIVPLRPVSPALPGGTLPIYSRSGTLFGYDPNYVTPYTQNFNLVGHLQHSA